MWFNAILFISCIYASQLYLFIIYIYMYLLLFLFKHLPFLHPQVKQFLRLISCFISAIFLFFFSFIHENLHFQYFVFAANFISASTDIVIIFLTVFIFLPIDGSFQLILADHATVYVFRSGTVSKRTFISGHTLPSLDVCHGYLRGMHLLLMVTSCCVIILQGSFFS